MASIREVIDGLLILSKTAKIPKGEKGETDRMTVHLGGAEHDILYGPDSSPSVEDCKKLEALGWHFEEETDSWCRFT